MKRWIVVLVCLAVPAVHAAERFTIERIEVRNAERTSTNVLAGETMLREGSEASEEEVRDGVRRLARLPFVFAADYVLQPGSDASRRIVVITVRENRPLWFLLDGRFAQVQEPVDMLDHDFPDPTAEWKHAAGGVRWLFRDGGLAHFGMTVLRNRHLFRKNYSAYELGYTRHRILGTPLFATAIVRSPVDSLEEKTFTPEAIVGFALTPNQTLKLEYEDTSFRRDTIRIAGVDFLRLQAERNLAASWTFDTTSDSFAPTSGTFVKVEPFVWMGDRASFSGRPGGFDAVADHATATGVDVTAKRHWQISDVSTVSAGLLAGYASIEQRRNPAQPGSNADWRNSFEVLEGGYRRRIRGSHVEASGRIVLRQLRDEVFVSEPETTSYEASVAWTRRSPRATLRIGFGYVD